METGAEAAGFNGSGQGIDIAHELDRWQSARDPLVWKLILSPEFGDRMDLERLTREVMKRMEQDLGTRLEWVAVSHHNTEHPHVHVALRGLRDDGQALRLERSYVKEGIRAIAAEACTRQLGYRTELDAAEAERREVFEKRYTSLDRAILNTATAEGSPYLNVVADPNRADLRGNAKLREQHIAARLVVLENMGLAEAAGPNAWHLKRDAEAVLRAMQRVNDHQKILAAQGSLMSDARLPIEVLRWNAQSAVEGRVLMHGEDEFSGRNYLLLEGTDARVYFIHYTPEMDEARSRGQLRTNSFVRLRRLYADGDPSLEIQDLGSADLILKDRGYLEGAAQRLLKRGILPSEDGGVVGWDGIRLPYGMLPSRSFNQSGRNAAPNGAVIAPATGDAGVGK